jgi:L-ascorbate metabolism protein UlaG (beta-lactamase superfamily)
MKNLVSIVTVVFFLFSSIVSNGDEKENAKTARVTYIANSGFIVKVGDRKVMFDGLFQNGMNRYLEPDEQTVTLMKNGLAPFDDLELVFISNYHADHFDPYLATQFMLNNKEVKMVCPQQVINKMKIFTSDYELIKNRIVETTPLANTYDRLLISGFEIVACHLKHEKVMNDHVENMAYLIKMNGVKIFHSGDSSSETLDDLKGIQLSDLNIDIAFLADKYAVGRAAIQTNKLVDARYNVLMHIEKFVTDKTMQAFCERTKLQPRPHVFQIRNEYQDFYINDFFEKKVGDDSSLTFLEK